MHCFFESYGTPRDLHVLTPPFPTRRSSDLPDLVFLDIQMPGFDGFSVVQGMMEIEQPLFIFVTAYSDHAIRAFEAQAVDYLMKPVDEDRLADALDRVRHRRTEQRNVPEVERLREVLAEVAPEDRKRTRLNSRHSCS